MFVPVAILVCTMQFCDEHASYIHTVCMHKIMSCLQINVNSYTYIYKSLKFTVPGN